MTFQHRMNLNDRIANLLYTSRLIFSSQWREAINHSFRNLQVYSISYDLFLLVYNIKFILGMSQTNIGGTVDFGEMLDADISAIEGNPEDLILEVSKLRQELDEMRNELALKDSQLSSQRNITKGLETQTKMQSGRILRLEETIKDLKEQIQVIKTNPSSSAISAYDESEFEALRSEISELKNENSFLKEGQEKYQKQIESFEQKERELNSLLIQKAREIETLKFQSPERNMSKSNIKKDESPEKERLYQNAQKQISALKAERFKKTEEFENKIQEVVNKLNQSNKVRDGLRKRCNELEEELKKAKSSINIERTISEEVNTKSESPSSEHEIEVDFPVYNPHKASMETIFNYLDKEHDIKEKLRYLNYIIYVTENKLEEMSSVAQDF